MDLLLNPVVGKTHNANNHASSSSSSIRFNSRINSQLSDDEDEDELERLYKMAMEEDEEWYNTFVRDILDSDTHPSSSSSSLSLDEDSTTDTRKESKGKEPTSTKKTAVELKSRSDPSPEVMDTTQTQRTKASSKTTVMEEDDAVDDSKRNNRPSNEDDDFQDLMVQYRDWRGRVRRVSLTRLEDLGYSDKQEIYQLKPEALDFILQDQITRPKKDILPKAWLIDYDQSPQVKILKRKRREETKAPIHNDDDDNDDVPPARSKRSRTYEPPTTSTTPSGNRRNSRRRMGDNDSSYAPSSQRPRRSPPKPSRSRRNTIMDDNEDDDDFWMDISTFKQFLRKEMDLRLWILGPDWRDQIKSESLWRLNLYKKWKSALNDGIGKDFTEDYARYPVTENTRQRETKPKRISSSRQNRNYYDRDDPREYNYRTEYNSQPKRPSRPTNKRPVSEDGIQEQIPYKSNGKAGNRSAGYDDIRNNADRDDDDDEFDQNTSASYDNRRSRRMRPPRDDIDYDD